MRTMTTLFFTALILILSAGCDMGAQLFTQDELGGMYTVDLSQKGVALSEISQASVAEPLSLSMTARSGAPDPAVLELRLDFSDGTEAARLRFTDPSAIMPDDWTDAIQVPDLLGRLPPFLLPSGLPDGYYVLTATARDDVGAKLFGTERLVLLWGGLLSAPAIAAYPGTVTTGLPVLFKLEGLAAPGASPWIQWIVDGSVRSEGSVSDRFDRFIWKSLDSPGVVSIGVRVYPFQPPRGFDPEPLFKTNLEMPIASEKDAAPAWDGSLRYRVRLPFEESLTLAGGSVVPLTSRVQGSPYPESSGLGFGYAFETGSGLEFEGRLLPVANGELGSVSLAFSIGALKGTRLDRASGLLYAYRDGNGSERLAFGIQEGVPYFRIDGAPLRASRSTGQSGSTVAIWIRPERASWSVDFYVDGQAAGSGYLERSGTPWSAEGVSSVAGQDGLPAVYLDMATLDGPYPAYLAETAAEYGSALVVASGFEGGRTWKGFTVSGMVTGLGDALALGNGSSLSIGGSADARGSFELSWHGRSTSWSLTMALIDGGFLTVEADGSVRAGGTVLGTLSFGDSASPVLAARNGGTELVAGGIPVRLPVALGPDPMPVIRQRGFDPLVIDSIRLLRLDTGPRELAVASLGE